MWTKKRDASRSIVAPRDIVVTVVVVEERTMMLFSSRTHERGLFSETVVVPATVTASVNNPVRLEYAMLMVHARSIHHNA